MALRRAIHTASFKSLAARNATFLLALNLIASPVAGLRPMRAARFLTCKIPSPEILIRSPFLRCLVIRPTRSARRASPARFVNWCSSASVAARCLSVTGRLVLAAGFADLVIGLPLCRCAECAIQEGCDSERKEQWSGGLAAHFLGSRPKLILRTIWSIGIANGTIVHVGRYCQSGAFLHPPVSRAGHGLPGRRR